MTATTYPLFIIANGWFVNTDQGNPNPFGNYDFHPQPRQSIGLTAHFTMKSCGNFSQDEIDQYHELVRAAAAQKADHKELTTKTIEYFVRKKFKGSETNIVAEVEKTLEPSIQELRDKEQEIKTFLDELNSGKAGQQQPIAMFDSSAGNIGLKMSLNHAADMVAQALSGKIIELHFQTNSTVLPHIEKPDPKMAITMRAPRSFQTQIRANKAPIRI